MSARAAGRRRTSSPVESDSTRDAGGRRRVPALGIEREGAALQLLDQHRQARHLGVRLLDREGLGGLHAAGDYRLAPGSRDIPTPVSALSDWGAWVTVRAAMGDEDPSEGFSGSEGEGPRRFYGFEEDLSDVAVPDVLPILPLRGVVIFPSAIVPLLISRGASLKLVEDRLAGDRMLGLVAQKNPEDEEPEPDGLYSRGTAGRILKMLKYPDGSVRILVQGLRRIEVAEFTQQRSRISAARVRQLHDVHEPSQDLEAMQAHMVNQFAKFVSMIPYLPDELQVVVMNIKDPGKVTDLIASNLNISLEEKQELLVDARRARAPRAAVHHPQPRDRAARARTQDPVAGAVRAQQEPEGVLPAPADEGDPEGARRGRRARPPRSTSCASKIDEARPAARGAQGRRARARAPAHDPARVRRAHRRAHLPRMARRRCRGRSRPRTTSTSTTRGRCSTRTTTTSRRSRTASSSTSPCAS